MKKSNKDDIFLSFFVLFFLDKYFLLFYLFFCLENDRIEIPISKTIIDRILIKVIWLGVSIIGGVGGVSLFIEALVQCYS
ncbi:MAG: hypothetical protein ACTSO2_19080 [Promethearchaeota archaeon]